MDKINFCLGEYNFLNEDKNNYGLKWTEYNTSYAPVSTSDSNFHESFKYTSSLVLKGLPESGAYDTYWGGGYVFKLLGNSDELIASLEQLESMNWINRNTRAVFIEFPIYNPNINLLISGTILFEFLPSGTLAKNSKFIPLNIINKSSSYMLAQILGFVVYMLVILLKAIREIKDMYKLGLKKYIAGFWKWIEWLQIIFSIVSVGIFAYQLIVSDEIVSSFAEASGEKYINLKIVSYWNEVFMSCLSLCVVFATLKFIKILKYDKNMLLFSIIFKQSIKSLMSFSILFLLVYFAFVQLQFLIFGHRVAGYSDFVKAMETAFLILLGKFEVSSLIAENTLLSALIFIAYNLILIMIMLNMFLSIIGDVFTEARKELELSDNNQIFSFMWFKIKRLFKSNKSRRRMKKVKVEDLNYVPSEKFTDLDEITNNHYVDYLKIIPNKIETLMKTVDRVNNFVFIFHSYIKTV